MSANLALAAAAALSVASLLSAEGKRAAAVLFLDVPGRRLLLLRRGPTDPWRPGWWNLPGGVVEEGETFEEGAAREAVEEAGLTPRSLVEAYRMEDTGFDMRIFVATRWSGDVEIDHESDAFRWVPWSDLGKVKVLPGAAEALASARKRMGA